VTAKDPWTNKPRKQVVKPGKRKTKKKKKGKMSLERFRRKKRTEKRGAEKVRSKNFKVETVARFTKKKTAEGGETGNKIWKEKSRTRRERRTSSGRV